MNVHIISIFPESFDSYFSASMLMRAKNMGRLNCSFYPLMDFSDLGSRRVDDKAFGMHGQVIAPKPLSKAIEHVFSVVGKKIPVVFLSPRWELLTQAKSEEYFSLFWEEFLVICGHYEWIDERIIEKYVDYHICIGEYILTSGELATMVLVDVLVRQIPGVLWNPLSGEEESFSQKLNRQKEYPVYTRPRVFEWMSVPDVLVSGNHAAIEKWKKDNIL